MPSCAAYNCTNRGSLEFGIKLYRFPLANKSRLHQWLVNIKRDNWKPTPSSRLCSLHFEKDCFYQNNKGQVRLTKTAVPTIFSLPDCLQTKKARLRLQKAKVKRWSVLNSTLVCEDESQFAGLLLQGLHVDHTYCANEDDTSSNNTVSSVSTTDAAEVAVLKVTGAQSDAVKGREVEMVHSLEDNVISSSRDHCYATLSVDGNNQSVALSIGASSESPEILKRNFNLLQDKLKTCRKRLKSQSNVINRLRRKVSSLSSVILELKGKDPITSECAKLLKGSIPVDILWRVGEEVVSRSISN